MKVESRWDLLKRAYLLPYNLPYLNLFVQIVDTKLLTKFENDLGALKIGVKKPYWWKQFVQTWNYCASSPVQHTYNISSVIFTYSCPA